MVHHDPAIPALGPIVDLAWNEIQSVRLSNGETIPSLDESLSAMLKPPTPIGEVWIELKSLPESSDTTLLEAIDRSPLPGRCAVHSFDHRIVARLGRRRPSLRRGVLSASYPLDPVAPMVAAGGSALWQEWHLIDGPLVDAVHRSGGELIAWAVNEAEPARRLERLGVDTLCGNWPDRLRSG